MSDEECPLMVVSMSLWEWSIILNVLGSAIAHLQGRGEDIKNVKDVLEKVEGNLLNTPTLKVLSEGGWLTDVVGYSSMRVNMDLREWSVVASLLDLSIVGMQHRGEAVQENIGILDKLINQLPNPQASRKVLLSYKSGWMKREE